MVKPLQTGLAAALSFGLVVGMTNASAGVGQLSGSGSVLSSGGSETQDRSGSMLDAVVDRFLIVKRATVSVAGEPEPTTAKGECPEEKKPGVADADGEGGEDEQAPVGPEPIYFAF